jgi:hypothetical protein
VGGAGTGGEGEKKADGIGCGDDAECQSALCVDGVCCESACDGTCETCDLAAAEGTCSPQAPGTDPDGECGEGLCSGAAACATGTEIWTKNATGPTGSAALSVDSQGAVVVSVMGFEDVVFPDATVSGSGSRSGYVAKLSPTGDVLWSDSAALFSSDYKGAFTTTVTPEDDVVVAGYSEEATELGGPTFGEIPEFFVTKLGTDGEHAWTKSFTVTEETFGTPVIATVTADDAGNVYAFGSIYSVTVDICSKTLGSNTDYSLFGFKLNSDGDCEWAHEWAMSEAGSIYDAATDGTTIYLTGYLDGSLDLGSANLTTTGDEADIFIAALPASTGTPSWGKDFGDGAEQFGTGIAIHPSGDIVIVGWAQGNVDFGGATLTGSTNADVVLARFDGTGAHVDSARYGDSADQRAAATAVGADGDVYLAGTTDGLLDFGTTSASSTSARPFTGALHETGAGLWIRTDDLAGGASAVAVAPNGDVITFAGGAAGLRIIRYTP